MLSNLALLLLLAGPYVSGQHLVDTIHLDEVDIIRRESLHKAGIISSSMDSISLSQMQSRPLSQLLSLRSSLMIKSTGRGSLSTASFRGTDASHTKVYWNGIRINSPMTGQVDFSLIPVLSLDELTLLYGASSLTEGSGAFGGAIVLEQKPERKDGFSLALNQEFASFGTYSSSALLAAGNGRIRTETSIYRNSSVNDHLYFNTDVIPRRYLRLQGAEYRQKGLLQEFYYRPAAAHALTMHIWYQDALRNLPAVMSYEGSGRQESQADRNLRTSLEWSYYTPSVKLMLRSGYLDSKLDYDLNQLDIGYIQYDSGSREKNIHNTLLADISKWESTRLTLQLKVDQDNARIHDRIRDEGYHHIRREASLLAAVYQQLGKAGMIYAMARQDRIDHQWLPIMPSAGFKIGFAENMLSLKTSVCRNYNMPSLNDLYWIPGGNPGLKPEQGVNADMGLDYRVRGRILNLSASANVFGAWIRDWIIWRPTNFRYWEAENLARVVSRGFESRMEMEMEWNRLVCSLNGHYAFTRSTNESQTGVNDQSRGSQLVYIPEHTAHMHLNLGRAGYSLGTSLSYTGRRHTQPSNEVSDFVVVLNPYFLTDIYLGKEFRMGRTRAGFRFAVYNLLNISYQAVLSRPMPLRNFALGIRWEI
jgi:iron complex outermembrane receptor protein